MPEDLPTPEKSIQQIEQEQMARLKPRDKVTVWGPLGNGFAVEPESVEAVVEATSRLWDDDAGRARIGAEGKRRVLERFDWRRMSDILETEYLEIFSNRA